MAERPEGLGRLIGTRRRDLGWTQAQLAELLGLRQGTLSTIESREGTWLPDPDAFRLISRVLGLRPSEMLAAAGYSCDDATPEAPQSAEELLAAVSDLVERSALPDNHKDILLSMFHFGDELYKRKIDPAPKARPRHQRRRSKPSDDDKA